MTYDYSIMAQFIKRISEYFDGQVVTFVLDSLRKRVHSIRDCLLISDSRSLAGIVNEGSFDCVTSIAALNDYVHLNKDLTKIHMLLNSRGVFIGYVETSEQYAQHVHSRHNYILAQFMILLSFVFGRVIPRLFGARQIIEKCGLVKHHGLTKCEALGRLRYCGFQIMRLREFGKRLYFLARKSSAPLNGAPCEGMLIKIRKVGLKGNIIQCYKLRTMHSYANYLHDYILDNLEIDNNGKVVGDFRVPTWGKILRKLWLDEMPQLLNILKGELTFIGLRHL